MKVIALSNTYFAMEGKMAKVQPLRNLGEGPITMYSFYCPGCKYDHAYIVNNYQRPNAPVWQFNGDVDNPTFTTSLLIHGHPATDKVKFFPRCHLFVTDGRIIYCSDSEHELKGQTVEMKEVEE